MADPAATSASEPAAETPAERRQRMLARNAALELACDLQQAALAAPEPEQKVRFALGFHHVSRSMRQSLALEARFDRDAQRDTHEAAAREQARATQATAVRKTQVQAGVERLIWTELEPEEAEVWTADLAERLDRAALDDDFTDEAVDDHIERAARELGLTGAEAHEYIPRSLRRRTFHRPRRDWRALVDALEFDDDPEDEEEAAPAAPAEPVEPVVPYSFDPTPRALAAPRSPLEPPPEPPPVIAPPPDPPPPEPYLPPWERLPPNAIFPGGSGY